MVGAAPPSSTLAAPSSNQGPAAAAAVDDEHQQQQQDTTSATNGGHPYGVKPWGNFLTDGSGQEVGGGCDLVCGGDRSISRSDPRRARPILIYRSIDPRPSILIGSRRACPIWINPSIDPSIHSSIHAQALRVRAGGLGPWLRALPDEVLVHSFLPCLEGPDLAR